MSAPPPCAGQWRLFDSTDPVDHKEAAELCESCPMIDACRGDLDKARAEALYPAYGPAGTWAGQLVGAPSRLQALNMEQRRADEDAAYTEDEARNCAARWHQGERNDYVKNGRRIYERRGREARNAAKRGAAA